MIMRYVRRLYHWLHVDCIFQWISFQRVNKTIPHVIDNYRAVLHRLRLHANDSNRRINVLFVCGDCTKWKVQSVYNRMLGSSRFSPMIAITLYGWHDDVASAEDRALKTFNYFQQKGMRAEFAYSFSKHKPLSLSRFKPDIVFYDQPWDIFPAHMPDTVSSYALTCYVAYMVPNLQINFTHVALPFHRYLFRHFTLSKTWSDDGEAFRNANHISAAGVFCSTGHPMLDQFSKDDFGHWDENGCVIYAPHWAFAHKDNPNSLNISTFLWTGIPILKYAQKHPEIKWSFKPHPVLRGMLLKSGVMALEDINAYYEAWEQLGECCYTGDYSDLFKRSRAMITDCSSFLSEYACTGKPLVRLVSPDDKTNLSPSIKPLINSYYHVCSLSELEPMLNKILVRREDPNCEERQAAAKAMNLLGVDAAGNIVSQLESLIFGRR